MEGEYVLGANLLPLELRCLRLGGISFTPAGHRYIVYVQWDKADNY